MLMAPVACVLGNLTSSVIICICLSLQISVDGLPCDLCFLIGAGKVVDFHFVQLFSYCKEGSAVFQALYVLKLK